MPAPFSVFKSRVKWYVAHSTTPKTAVHKRDFAITTSGVENASGAVEKACSGRYPVIRITNQTDAPTKSFAGDTIGYNQSFNGRRMFHKLTPMIKISSPACSAKL